MLARASLPVWDGAFLRQSGHLRDRAGTEARPISTSVFSRRAEDLVFFGPAWHPPRPTTPVCHAPPQSPMMGL